MKKSLMTLGIIGFLGLAQASGATVLNFEDNAYQAFNWTNFAIVDGTNFESDSGYVNGVVSPNNVAYNPWGQNIDMQSDNPFILNGGYFTGAWNDGLNIDITAYLAGNLVYNKTFIVDTDAPSYLDFGGVKVDDVIFHSHDGTPHGYIGTGVHFAMDNLEVNGAPTPSPEPSTMLLGLIGLGGAFAKKRKTA